MKALHDACTTFSCNKSGHKNQLWLCCEIVVGPAIWQPPDTVCSVKAILFWAGTFWVARRARRQSRAWLPWILLLACIRIRNSEATLRCGGTNLGQLQSPGQEPGWGRTPLSALQDQGPSCAASHTGALSALYWVTHDLCMEWGDPIWPPSRSWPFLCPSLLCT